MQKNNDNLKNNRWNETTMNIAKYILQRMVVFTAAQCDVVQMITSWIQIRIELYRLSNARKIERIHCEFIVLLIDRFLHILR